VSSFLHRLLLFVLCLLVTPLPFAQSKTNPSDKFRQLEELLPSPNEQRADFKIDVQLDDAKQRIIGLL